MLRAFFAVHPEIVYFAYGLAFFIMGWSIWLQRPSSSTLRLARRLPFLALFGLVHGVNEWFDAFLPGMKSTFSPQVFYYLTVLHAVMLSVSFLFLFLFGATLVADTDRRYRWLPPAGVAIIVFWFVNFVVWRTLTQDTTEWFLRSEIWARYLLAFPGAALAALALRLQVPQFRELAFPLLIPDLRRAGMTLLLYTLTGGLLVPPGAFFPANVLNRDTVLAVGLPSPVLRGICAVLIAVFMVRLLRVFEAESRRRLELAEAARAAAEERERLGRDLHDGILQSIFAAGLGLQVARERLGADSADAGRRIDLTLERLDRVMGEIRAYITGLDQHQDCAPDLREQLHHVVAEFRQCSGVPAKLDVRGIPAMAVPRRLVPEVVAVVREALANVSRHARAWHAEVVVELGPADLLLTVRDDGRGFHPEEARRQAAQRGHLGLRNLGRRAEMLGGRIHIDSAPGRGTVLQVRLPYEAAAPGAADGKGDACHGREPAGAGVDR